MAGARSPSGVLRVLLPHGALRVPLMHGVLRVPPSGWSLAAQVERIDAREGSTRIHYRYIKHIPMCTQSTPRGRARAGRVGCARKHHARDTGRREQGGCAHARAVCSRSISHRCTRAHTRTHAQMRTNTHEHAHLHTLARTHMRARRNTHMRARAHAEARKASAGPGDECTRRAPLRVLGAPHV